MSPSADANHTLRPLNSSRAHSHQTGFIQSHWNDLPMSLIPSNPSSRSSSRNTTGKENVSTNLQRGPSPLRPNNRDASDQLQRENDSFTQINLSYTPDNSDEVDDEELKPLTTLLPALFNLPTTLPKNEHTLLQTRIKKILPDPQPFLQELLTRLILREEVTPLEAKAEIVGFMKREQGVAGWASSVRRVVECVVMN